MNIRSLLLPAFVALLAVPSIACGGNTAESSNSEPGPQPSPSPSPSPSPQPSPQPSPSPSPSDDPSTWPESVESTNPWPSFGSTVSGAVTAPAWVAPVQMGCAVRQRVRTQPSEGLEPGNAPRTVVEATLDTTCRPSGSTVTVVDDPSYPSARLFVGSCAQGFSLSTASAKLATVAFATPADCDAFVALRASSVAGTAKRRLRTALRLDALTPDAAFTVTSFGEAADTSSYEVTDGS